METSLFPLQDLLSYTLAAFALVGSPGPATLSLAATGAAFGARRGLGYLLGIEAGMIVIMIITSTGVMGALMAVPRAAPLITSLGAAYILFLAYKIATSKSFKATKEGHASPSFLGGLFLSLVNPKAYASLAALFSGFVLIKGGGWDDALAKGIVLLVILTLVDLAWLCLGSVLVQRIKSAKVARLVNVIFAVLLLVSVAFALV
ncbi:MAG: LysE family translocator [Magnetovibrio sp.]|nr:LysE family translocator [Magnetovibrio sp.]